MTRYHIFAYVWLWLGTFGIIVVSYHLGKAAGKQEVIREVLTELEKEVTE
jgi:hypothetical protein